MISICGKKYGVDISHLNLANKGLTRIPEEIKYLTNLRRLNLSNNKIKEIPKHIIDCLINLRSLELSNNKITEIPKHIIDSLVNLHRLDLSNNKITEIPKNMFDITTKLNTLYIHFNKITAIPKHIFDHLNNLEWLDLSYNQITAIPEHTFDSLISLLYLNLSYNQIMEIPKHLFDSLTNLNSLYFHDNKITVIPEHIFDKFINLQTLFIDNNQTTTMPEHIFDQLIKLQALDISRNKITAIPISILSCRLLLYFNHRNNPIERIDVRIQRFIDHMQKYRFNENIQNYGIFKDSQNLLSSSIHSSHSSVKNSINNLMRDTFTMDKEDIIKQLIEESPNCLQSLLCYLDDKNVHSTLYLTFFEVFVKVWGRIIGSDFKADLIKRLDKEIMESEYKSFTGRISRLLNVLVGYFGDINVTISNSERISTIISSVLNGREMSEEIKEKCREYLKKADIEEDEIEKSLDV